MRHLKTKSLHCLLLLNTIFISAAHTGSQIIFYDHKKFKGESLKIKVPEIDECFDFWDPQKTIPSKFAKFNNKGDSVKLPDGVCIRIFQYDCDWVHKGQVLDIYPDSSWTSNFALAGFNGLSAFKRIQCPNADPLVVLYDSPSFHGNNISLHELKNVGDCQELWSPHGHATMISEHLRQFNDKTLSIKIHDENICVRAYAAECGSYSVIQDFTPTTPQIKNLRDIHFGSVLSAVELIVCPSTRFPITLHSKICFDGDNITIIGLDKVGDCISLWSPRGHVDHISEDLRRFNDKTRSLKIPEGVQIRLYEHHCGNARFLDVRSNDSFLDDIGKVGFAGIVSSIELIDIPEEVMPTPIPDPTPIPHPTPEENCPSISPKSNNTYKIIGALRCANFSNEVLERGNGVYQFRIKETDGKLVEFFIDMTPSNGGFVGLGYSDIPLDATITISAKRFQKLFTRQITGVDLHKSQNIKVEGDKNKAQQLSRALETLHSEYGDIDILNLPMYCIPKDFSGMDVVNELEEVLECLTTHPNITDEMVDSTKACFDIKIIGLDGRDTEQLVLNMKTKPGFISETLNNADEPDARIEIADVAFVEIMKGKLKPFTAFMQGRVSSNEVDKLARLEGQYQKFLDGLSLCSSKSLLPIQPSPTPTAPTTTSSSTTEASSGPATTELPISDAMKIIKQLQCAKISDRVLATGNGIFQYHIKQSNGQDLSFFLDLKNKPGMIDVGINKRAVNVFRIGSEDDFVEIFTGKIGPVAAYLSGKIKVEGELSSAQRLQSAMDIMKKDNGNKDFRFDNNSVYC